MDFIKNLLVKPAYAIPVDSPIIAPDIGTLVGGRIFPALVQLGAMLAFFYAAWGGLKYIMAEGDSKKVEGAKNMITQAIIGFVILFSAYVFMKIIDAVLGSQFTA